MKLNGVPVFCSWSGGKDGAFALHEAVLAGAMPRMLVSMMIEGGERSRSHGLHREVLQDQADAIGIPIRFAASSWDKYDENFVGLVNEAVAGGSSTGIFGDIDIEDHRKWVEGRCAEAGASAQLPLWQRDRELLVGQVIEAGFKAVIVAVRDGVLPESLLGRVLDEETLEEIGAAGADLAGENGEYHSLVVDGPIFRRPVDISLGERQLRDGVWFTDLRLDR